MARANDVLSGLPVAFSPLQVFSTQNAGPLLQEQLSTADRPERPRDHQINSPPSFDSEIITLRSCHTVFIG